MSVARASRDVGATAAQAFALWVDSARWEAFIDGFADIDAIDEEWPAPGSEVVWRSVPAGRGRVRERVITCDRPSRFETRVTEERLEATQVVEFEERGEGALVVLSLEYALAGSGPLRWLTDVLFIRRAQTEALARTLARFAAEASSEPQL